MAKTSVTLSKFRKEIDAIDDRILDLLADRVAIVKQVGDYKRKQKTTTSIIRPGREAEMIRRIASRKGDFPRAAVAQIWRMIISSAINMEENTAISAHAHPGNRECYWLAREYFGAFTPTKETATMMDVLMDIAERRATVGVLQLSDDEGRQSWWSRLVELPEEKQPRVFARLPFIQMAPSGKSGIVTLGHVEPEETGDDTSLWVLRVEETVEFRKLEPLFKKAKLQADAIGGCRDLGAPKSRRNYLLATPGYRTSGDKTMATLISLINAPDHAELHRGVEASAHFIGAYANPVSFE